MIAAVAKQYFRFDLETITAPIRPDAASGDDLRYEGTYDAIRKAREEDDASLQQGIWKHDLKTANWSRSEALALQALRDKTKDLQIAAWLTEAWMHIHGLGGLREGFRVISALCERFWDTLYPGGSPEDPDFRAGPIVWLNEKLPTELKLMPLSMPENDELQPYCLADWERTRRPPPPKPTKKGALPEPHLTMEIFERSLLATPTAYYSDLAGELDRAIEAAKLCQDVLDFRWGKDGPSVHSIARTLEEMRGIVSTVLSTREIPGITEESDTAGEFVGEGSEEMPDTISVNGEPENGSALAAAGRGPIRNRADAYRMLNEAADFLARTEPHSPAPYLVRRAIAWGSLKFEDLVQELVQNKNELDTIYKLLQIHK